MLDSTLSLREIEHELREAITKRKGTIRTIGDLELTSEDYKILSLRFRGFRKYQNDINIYEQFTLSLLAFGSYQFMGEEDPLKIVEKINEIASVIPQYLQRKILDEFDSAIKEYSLSNPSIHLKTVPQLISLFLLGSYNTDTFYHQYFAEIENCSDEDFTEEYIEKLDRKYFYREYAIYEKEVLNHAFGMQRRAFLDCMNNKLDIKEMLVKYTRLPYRFIKNCCEWCECHEKKNSLKVVK
ncbi:hypothetical protein SAMN04487772_11246 [[Clostridium] polysaccharolyticum]|uniref:Uncharacterized protein n=2 Tax=[Clostridium] polysaccharolyticum TaxID=29364 RepID=A0A1I0D001_9FIRM|nr:hypothetical protein SAMN04487772_11246 [[Clostridium] polysaccharolyticum]